ncbi:MAG: glycosyltransferase family 4 protein [Spirulinaceae cyanobacterium]
MSKVLVALIFLSFGIAIALTALFRQGFQSQFLDIPNHRSSHTQPTPRGGGLGFIVAFAITSVIASFTLDLANLVTLWLILTPIAVVGFLDDRGNVPALVRYIVQLSAAGMAVASLGFMTIPRLEYFGMGGEIVAIALTIFGMTALINFYNFMDGLDGLVASVSIMQLTFLAFYLQQPVFLLLVGSITGFLYWNWSPAKIFMGDVGSTFLGATIGIAFLNAANPSQAWTALAITLPLTGDAIYTICCRLLRRENIFQGHRSHIYQRLQQSGYSHGQVALIYLTFTGIIALAIATLNSFGSWLSLLITILAIATGEIHLRSRLTTFSH